MNVNMLITENNFAGTRGTSPVPSTPDASKKDAKFSLTTDDKHSQVNNLEKQTADYVRQEVQNRKEPVNKSPQDFTQSNHKKTKSENPCEAENKTNPKEENAASGTTKRANKQQNSVQSSLAEHFAAEKKTDEANAQKNGQQNLIKSFLAEHFIAVEQSKEGTATKIEPKVGE